MKPIHLALAVAAVLAAGSQGFAAVVATVQTGSTGTFSVSADDLADASEGGTTSFAGTADFGSSPGKVIDGDVYNGDGNSITTHTLSPNVGNELTLLLDPSSASGYDISSIVVLTGTNGTTQNGRADHNYTIQLRPVGGAFGPSIISVADSTVGTEIRVTIADNLAALLGSGIDAVKFTFGNSAEETENMYREIDVFGSATVVIPTPAALPAALAMIGLIATRRRRERNI